MTWDVGMHLVIGSMLAMLLAVGVNGMAVAPQARAVE